MCIHELLDFDTSDCFLFLPYMLYLPYLCHGQLCLPLDAAMEKILDDQKEFEKEHQFMQVCMFFFYLFCIFFIAIIMFKQLL